MPPKSRQARREEEREYRRRNPTAPMANRNPTGFRRPQNWIGNQTEVYDYLMDPTKGHIPHPPTWLAPLAARFEYLRYRIQGYEVVGSYLLGPKLEDFPDFPGSSDDHPAKVEMRHLYRDYTVPTNTRGDTPHLFVCNCSQCSGSLVNLDTQSLVCIAHTDYIPLSFMERAVMSHALRADALARNVNPDQKIKLYEETRHCPLRPDTHAKFLFWIYYVPLPEPTEPWTFTETPYGPKDKTKQEPGPRTSSATPAGAAEKNTDFRPKTPRSDTHTAAGTRRATQVATDTLMENSLWQMDLQEAVREATTDLFDT